MAKIAKKTASRIAELFLFIKCADEMIDLKYDFKRWSARSDEAKLELREMGIDLGMTYAEIDAEFRAKHPNFAA